MPTLELSDEQVLSLLKQLPPERQRAALLALATGAAQRRDERMDHAETNCGAFAANILFSATVWKGVVRPVGLFQDSWPSLPADAKLKTARRDDGIMPASA